MPETGGAETFTRRAFNDLIGFVTGWALFLDYLIVIALSALFLPHYLGHAIGVTALDSRPWDTIIAVAVVFAIGAARLTRRKRMYTAGAGVAAFDLVTQLLLVVLGHSIHLPSSHVWCLAPDRAKREGAS